MTPRRGLLLLAALGLFAGPASASPESDKLFRDGRALLKAGQIPEACEAFAASQKLEPKVGTLLNLADCREKQGQTATAWQLFLDARQLAAAQHDARQAEADKRATAIKAKLTYLTIAVPPDRQLDGLVIKRNGVTVERAQWNTAIAVDPGSHVVEAAAPGFKPWSATHTLGVKQKLSVAVELVAEPAVEPPKHDPAARVVEPAPGRPAAAAVTTTASAPEPRPAQPLPVRPLAIGLMVGGTSDQDAVIGGRMSGSIAVPHGALRPIASLLYTRFDDDPDNPDSSTELFALGISADYVWMPTPQLGFAAGLGLGLDRHRRNLDRESDSTGWWTLRASPLIVRVLDGQLEAGFHLQYVRTSGRGVTLGLVAIDLFPL